jgi:Mce-associated membrane protein
MSDMPPKKKRPRVAGQPRPGSSTGRPATGSGSAKPRPTGTPTASKRAPIQRLGSSDESASASPTTPKKSAPRTPTTKPGRLASGTGSAPSAGAEKASTGEVGKVNLVKAGSAKAGTAKSGVAKTAPSRGSAGEAASTRGPLILAAIGAAALLIGLIGLLHPGAGDLSDKSFIDKSATSAVLGQTETAACAILGPRRGETIDKWIATSRGVLIGAARQEWEKQMPTNRSMIEQTQQTNDCRVDAIGLRGLTGGGNGATAQVLASLVISMNQGAANAGSLVVGIQYQVVNQDGKWKISRVDAW